MEIKLNNKTTAVIILVLISLFSLIYLGFGGFRTILGLIIVVMLPFYFIFDKFKISLMEKIFFSFFISLGIFPVVVYWLGIIMSFRLSVLISFLLFGGLAVFLRRKKFSF